jgi:hypothetical protein
MTIIGEHARVMPDEPTQGTLGSRPSSWLITGTSLTVQAREKTPVEVGQKLPPNCLPAAWTSPTDR